MIEIKYKIKNVFEFVFDGVPQKIEFIFGNEYDAKDPWFPIADFDSGQIQIGINANSLIHDDIQKATKNIGTGTNKLLIKTISLDCVKQVLRAEGYEVDLIAKFAKDYIEI